MTPGQLPLFFWGAILLGVSLGTAAYGGLRLAGLL